MTELSPSASAELSTTRAWLLALLMAAFVFVGIAPTLTWPEFTGGNENIVVQTALEMRHGGPCLVPNMMGEPRVKKPPLVAWITALSMRPTTVAALDGPHGDWHGRDAAYRALAWQVRWTGLLAGCVMMLATFELGRVIGGTTTGLCAAAAVATNLLFLKYMRQSTSDVHLAMWVTIANAAYVHGLLRRRWWLAATLGAFATGMAFLCKGPVALLETVLPLAVGWLIVRRGAVLSLPLRGRLGGGGERDTAIDRNPTLAAPTQPPPEGEGQEASPRTKVLQLLLGLLIFTAVALPWFLHVYLTVPNVWHTWFTEVSRQGATDLQADSPLTYLELIPSLWPWVIFGFLGLLACRHDRRLRIALIGVVLPLLVMSLVKDRKERYLLPMIAPAAVLCGGGAAAWWRAMRSPAAWPRTVLVIHAIVLIVGAAAFVIVGAQQKTLAGGTWFPPKLVSGALLVLLSLTGWWWIAQRRLPSAVIAFTMIVMLLLGELFMFGYSQTANAISPFKPMAETIRGLGPVSAPVPVHDWLDAKDPDKRVDEGLPIYLNRTVTRQDPATLTSPAVVIVKQQNDSKPKPTMPPPWRPIATAREKRILWWAFER